MYSPTQVVYKCHVRIKLHGMPLNGIFAYPLHLYIYIFQNPPPVANLVVYPWVYSHVLHTCVSQYLTVVNIPYWIYGGKKKKKPQDQTTPMCPRSDHTHVPKIRQRPCVPNQTIPMCKDQITPMCPRSDYTSPSHL